MRSMRYTTVSAMRFNPLERTQTMTLIDRLQCIVLVAYLAGKNPVLAVIGLNQLTDKIINLAKGDI